jgi:hypothetical protein
MLNTLYPEEGYKVRKIEVALESATIALGIILSVFKLIVSLD